MSDHISPSVVDVVVETAVLVTVMVAVLDNDVPVEVMEVELVAVFVDVVVAVLDNDVPVEVMEVELVAVFVDLVVVPVEVMEVELPGVFVDVVLLGGTRVRIHTPPAPPFGSPLTTTFVPSAFMATSLTSIDDGSVSCDHEDPWS